MPQQYHRNPETGVYFRAETPHFSYSDGDVSEERLLKFVRAATDRSSASPELAAGIVDWPSYYHLSSLRCDLLRPVGELLTGAVLEVGAGCGAVTRYLGETARSVVAIEGSSRRSQIAAARCSGLSNVNVYCDNFEFFATEQKFDAVVCIGVIEYSPLFFSGSDPFGQMLSVAAGHLTPEGYMLIAIENRLGLKYFAGAPEDHTGSRFQGIEDLYPAGGPMTLGRSEWHRQLSAWNLENVAFLYPFPDYKHPQVILSEAAFSYPQFDASRLIRHLSAPDQDRDYERLMSEELVWPVLMRNGIAADMANSFLIVTRQAGARTPRWLPPALAFQYESERHPNYRRESRVTADPTGRLFVSRRRLQPNFATGPSYHQRVVDEQLPAGVPYMDGLYSTVNRPGWSPIDIARWAEPWFALLRAGAIEGQSNVPGELLEYIPSKLIAAPDGTIHSFDLEFVARDAQPIDFVLFRGLLASLLRVRTCGATQLETETTWTEVTFRVMEALGIPMGPARREAFLRMESKFQSEVYGTSLDRSLDRMNHAAFRVRHRAVLVSAAVDCFESQVFWRRAGEPFTEICSRRLQSEIALGTTRLRIEIPLCDPPPVELRLDLSDRPAVLTLLDLRLLSSEGNPLWVWDHAATAFSGCNEVLLLPTASPGEVAVIMPAFDPFLLLPVAPDTLAHLRQGASVEFQIRRDDLLFMICKFSAEIDSLRHQGVARL